MAATERPVGFFLSFRFKLMVAMILIVVTISLIVLFLTQNRAEAIYRDFLADQFLAQADLFFEKRDARLSAAREAIADALTNVRLIAALDAGDYENFYHDMGVELAEILGRYESRLIDRQRGLGTFYRYIRADGEVLMPTESSAGFVSGMDEELMAARIAQVKTSMVEESPDGSPIDQVGYLTLGRADQLQFYEVLVSPHINVFYSGDHKGDLIFGVPISSTDEFAGRSGEELKNALLLEDFLFSDDLPEESNASIIQMVSADSAVRTEKSDELRMAGEIEIGKVLYRVFYQSLSTSASFPESYQVSLFSLAGLQQLLRQLRGIIFGFAVLAVAVGAGLSYFASENMTRPILELVAGTEEIKKGNFEHHVKVRSRDEIGLLTSSYNDMSTELALKEKLRSVLDKVTDKEVAQRLINGSVELGGELRDITVLFCDIRGFTPLTEGMPPAEVINMLNEHMTALTKVVYDNRGVVDKFVGDEIMVLFGAPNKYGRDTINAAKCALSMVSERGKLNRSGDFQINIGIGLASGEVVAGNMGSSDRLNYTVLGEQVNLAARLCGSARPMEVLIDSMTEERLRGKGRMEPLKDMQLKGFEGNVTAFSLLEINEPA